MFGAELGKLCPRLALSYQPDEWLFCRKDVPLTDNRRRLLLASVYSNRLYFYTRPADKIHGSKLEYRLIPIGN